MKSQNSNIDYYQNSDLPLICALCCYGYCVEFIDRTNSRKAVFSIKRDEKLDELVQRYFTRQLPVDPCTFFNMQKNLKNRLYNS